MASSIDSKQEEHVMDTPSNIGYGSIYDQMKRVQSMNPTEALLTLEDGQTIRGYSFGAEKNVSGEVVFNTGMVGYPESLTDPSYSGEILVLTYPLIGNYGVPSEDELDEFGLHRHFESAAIQISALIVSDYSFDHSHHDAMQSLSHWLTKHGVPALFGVDTRMLTKSLRVSGCMLGKIEFAHLPKVALSNPYESNLVANVSRSVVEEFCAKRGAPSGEKQIRILAIDCGLKNNIIRYLCQKGVALRVVPWDYDINDEAATEGIDGLFISNGPGDPAMATATVRNVARFMRERPEVPIFGICLGNQIMALAAGAKCFKMKYGNRGMNQPVIDLRTSRCYITPQNHGFAVDESTLREHWKPFFRNANDHSNEGIIHSFRPWFSVQFHPEAMGGPRDTEFLFEMFLSRIRNRNHYEVTILDSIYHNITHIGSNRVDKVLLLGSGGLSIGQAGEFDYSGSQAIKALKEENVTVVLINPNIATVQTSSNMADNVYFLPVTPEYVTRVIEKERPDGILLQFGGQTALNCGITLKENGILERYGVRVLGTPVETIEMTEDREIFAQKLAEVDEKVAPSAIANDVATTLAVAAKIGYPVLLRSAFALGGLGSGFAENETELKALATKAFANAGQVIIDKSLRGWKEVEYEVVRDLNDNCITVCNMENFDPLGIHTGDSIVVAPSQTLTNHEYYMLRAAAIKVVRHLGVVGECNIQYALDPFSDEYCVIEVNARLSRSSALASKATGYPLAYVAAKLALNKPLTAIKNSITRATQACFEPSLDYVVVKVPKWDMKKFNASFISCKIGSAMKSVGEVMAIDRKFEAAMSKALRMVYGECDGFGFVPKEIKALDAEALDRELNIPSDIRIFAVAAALQRGYTVDRVHSLTRIDPWFLCKLRNIVVTERLLARHSLDDLPRSVLLAAKQNGCSDLQIARVLNEAAAAAASADTAAAPPSPPSVVGEAEVRRVRISKHGLTPFVKQIDTLAAEFPAFTNYLYVTYNGSEHDLVFDQKGIIVLGCGAYRIGSSCEFDWCAVSAVRAVRELNEREAATASWDANSSGNSERFGGGAARRYRSWRSGQRSGRSGRKGGDRKSEWASIVINYNPETVSTDYDECDRMYFEEISFERVLDIYEMERHCHGIIVSVGGQIPNNLAIPLDAAGCTILGTQPEHIDCAENRHRFSKLLDELHIDQPLWREARTLSEAQSFAQRVGFPVLIRPSYVLSGAAMNVSYTAQQLMVYLQAATSVSPDHPVVISKFVSGAKEIEFDGVSNAGKLVNYAISEHVENAGVHSGDATLILPPQSLYTETTKRIKKIAKQICSALQITGPFNIQFLCKDNHIKVIECNLRASRSFPFVSKTFNVNFISLATRAMVLGSIIKGYEMRPVNFNTFDMDYVCVKAPMFSFTRLDGADPVLRVEMASTGEVACFGDNKYEAFLKALISTNTKLPIPDPAKSTAPNMLRLDYIHQDLRQNAGKLGHGTPSVSPRPPNDDADGAENPTPSPRSVASDDAPFGSPMLKALKSASSLPDLSSYLSQSASFGAFKKSFRSNILISIGPQRAKYSFVDCASLLKQMGFTIYATENTHYFYQTHSIESVLVSKPSQPTPKAPGAVQLIESGTIHFVLVIPKESNDESETKTDGYKIRRKSVDFNVPLISNVKLAKLFVKSMAKKYLKSYEFAFEDDFIHIKSWKEYMQSANRYY